MKELDTASIATYSVETGFRLLVGFTGDRTQLAAAVDTLGLPNLVQRSSDPLGLLLTEPTANDAPFPTTSDAAGGTDAIVADTVENMQTMYQKAARSMYRDRVSRMLESFAKLAASISPRGSTAGRSPAGRAPTREPKKRNGRSGARSGRSTTTAASGTRT